MAKDLGLSRQTVARHLHILETTRLVEVKRRGRGLVDIIKLALVQGGKSFKAVFEKVLPTLPERAWDGKKRTVAWWVERYRWWREVQRVSTLEMVG